MGPARDETTTARAAGYLVYDRADHPVDPDAVRMLPETANGVAVAIAGDILMVVCPGIPAPADFRALEAASGMPVTVAVARPDVYATLRERAAATLPAGAPRALGPVLEQAAAEEASDVILNTGDVPRMRVAREVRPVGRFPVLARQDVEAATVWLTGRTPNPGEGALETVATYGESRWRVSAFHARGSLALTARRMPVRIPRLEDLGLPSAVVDLANAAHGLVLFVGPAGSGKTTSAAALVDRVNGSRRGQILTLEHPVEYVHTPMSCSVIQREVGVDVPTVAQGLRAALNQSPDTILIGELDDALDMQAALAAADSGHLVIATMTATSVSAAIHRILSSSAPQEQERVRTQLASALRAVIGQILLPTPDGRVQLVPEVLLTSEATRTLLRDGRTHELGALLENQVRSGMTSRERSLAAYVAAGRVAETVAMHAADHPGRLREHLARGPQSGPAPVPTTREPQSPVQQATGAPSRVASPPSPSGTVPGAAPSGVPGALGE